MPQVMEFWKFGESWSDFDDTLNLNIVRLENKEKNLISKFKILFVNVVAQDEYVK